LVLLLRCLYFQNAPGSFITFNWRNSFFIVRKTKQGHPSTMLFLLGLISYFLLVLGFQNNVQIGIRHVLMVYPLLYVLAGFIVQLPIYQKRTRLLSALLIAYSLVTYYYFYPNLISYSNEFIPIKKDAYKIMADSNLDFGQGKYALKKYLKLHPGVSIITDKPQSGSFVIGVNDYLDLKGDHKYSWIYDVLPDDQIDHSFLLFIIR